MKPRAAADSAVSGWLGSLAWERGLGAATREAYARDIAALAAFVAERAVAADSGADCWWARVGAADIADFLDSEKKRGLVANTRARRLSAVRGFFAWLRDEGRIPADPAASVALPKRRRGLPHVVSREETARLVEAPAPDSPEGLRDRALLELLYGCGLRESEAASLPVGALRFSDGVVRVRGKGGKDRLVPLGSRAEAALKAWLGAARDSFGPAPGEPAVFLGKGGRRMTRQGVWAVVKKHAKAAGLPSGVSPHWLRHCFATHLLSGGAPIRAIQELLGHSDIGTTQIYTKVDAGRLSSTVQKFHPRP